MSKSVTEIQQSFRQLRLAETAEGLPELLEKPNRTPGPIWNSLRI